MPISRWVDKTTMGHLYNGIVLGLKKKKIVPFAIAWMDLDNIMLSEISQSEKENAVWFHLDEESNEQTELTKKIETDS